MQIRKDATPARTEGTRTRIATTSQRKRFMDTLTEPFGAPSPPKVAVLGATGYVGSELCTWLWDHPGVELAFAGSTSQAGALLSDVVAGAPPVPLESPADVPADSLDIVFLALPAGSAGETATRLLARGTRVIDMSGDHRLKDPGLHDEIYGTRRSSDLAGRGVYGITEWVRSLLPQCDFIANPGCYPTTVALALGPLAMSGWLDEPVIVSSQSGVSGAGREPAETTHFCRTAEDVRPYKVGAHRHAPEMDQFLGSLAPDRSPQVIFTPHLVPIRRGLLSTIVVRPPRGTATPARAARKVLADRYLEEAFVEVLPEGDTSCIHRVVGSNQCSISVHEVRGSDQVILISAIDNLLKGAAGQAIQNMNVALDLDETLGLPRPLRAQSLPRRSQAAHASSGLHERTLTGVSLEERSSNHGS